MDERNPQLDVIETLDCPVIVQAGAGSGKTHTLTERILYALTPDVSGKTFARSVTNIVAITFTHKAAEELKSRLRGKLEGAGLHEQALLVDDSYISTIHGFATRILRENALHFGLDPNFRVIDEGEEAELFARAFNNALNDLYSGTDRVEEFLTGAQYEGAIIDGDNSELTGLAQFSGDDVETLQENIKSQIKDFITSVISVQSGEEIVKFFTDNMLQDEAFLKDNLLQTVHKMVSVLSSVPKVDSDKVFLGSFLSITEIMVSLSRAVAEVLSSISFDSGSKTIVERGENLNEVLGEIDKFLIDSHSVDTFDDDLETALEIFKSIKHLDLKALKDSGYETEINDFHASVAHLFIELLCVANLDAIQVYYRLAKMTFSELQMLKSNNKLSNNDLLRRCYEFLAFSPDICEKYKNNFDLIMIDEFQDTDNLQLKLIDLIAKDKFRNVCTVGDVQQSIYRFRGADVNVFRKYKETLLNNESGVKVFNLPNNYRSHSDILSLTDMIFADESMFGEEFLHLNAKGKINDDRDPVFEILPRVKIDVVNYKSTKDEPFSKQNVIAHEAREAANHFKTLYDAGINPGSMAILLSTLKSNSRFGASCEIAKIFQDALLDVGIESIISGGSTFSSSEEAVLIENLLNIARNSFDSQSLIEILKSDYFKISDDSLLVLCSKFDDSGDYLSGRDLSRGFIYVDDEMLSELNEDDRQSVSFIYEKLFKFIDNSSKQSTRLAIREFLSECGILDAVSALGSEGYVKAGNFEKALEIIKEIEVDSKELSHIQTSYSSLLKYSKEAPGVLCSSVSNYVQIMTVHASKGLEFDHVIVSEMRNGLSRNAVPKNEMIVQNDSIGSLGQQVFASMLKKDDWGDNNFNKICSKDNIFAQKPIIHQGMTAGELYRTLVVRNNSEEYDEAKRLLYVALTRAVKSVYLQVRIKGAPKDDYAGCGIWESLFKVFQWDYNLASSTDVFTLPNGSNGILCFMNLPQALHFKENDNEPPATSVGDIETDGGDADTGDNSSFEPKILPVRKFPEKLYAMPGNLTDETFFSYSNIEQLQSFSHELLDTDGFSIPIIEEEIDSFEKERHDSDKATAFGTAFHDAMQVCVMCDEREVPINSSRRMTMAMNRAFNNALFNSIVSSENVIPEMDFCVPFEHYGKKMWLRGAMDLIEISGDKARVIDYKTGTKPIDHSSQAKVYSWALLANGIKRVTVDFLHVEIESSDDPEDCLVQSFSYCDNDLFNLHEEIASELEKMHR